MPEDCDGQVGGPCQEPVTFNIYGGNKRKDRPLGGFYVNVDEGTSKTLDAASGLNPVCQQGGTAILCVQSGRIRRLTHQECERLQAFPDGYSESRASGRPSDGPRYRVLGNSMAVSVMAWIGSRIQEVSCEAD